MDKEIDFYQDDSLENIEIQNVDEWLDHTKELKKIKKQTIALNRKNFKKRVSENRMKIRERGFFKRKEMTHELKLIFAYDHEDNSDGEDLFQDEDQLPLLSWVVFSEKSTFSNCWFTCELILNVLSSYFYAWRAAYETFYPSFKYIEISLEAFFFLCVLKNFITDYTPDGVKKAEKSVDKIA